MSNTRHKKNKRQIEFSKNKHLKNRNHHDNNNHNKKSKGLDTHLVSDKIRIKKSNGEYQEFSKNKLAKSLTRSGASEKNIKYICDHIENSLIDGVTTREIYKKAYAMLRKLEKGRVIMRYSIQRALNELGPSGFPFEKFVGGIYMALGWAKVETGKKVKGQCVTHEVDLIAEKDGKKIVGELKFHNKNKIKTDLKVVLYVKERCDDLQRAGFFEDKKPVKALITNTRFSDNVQRYGKCTGMEVISWNYPREYNLHHMIIDSKLHPITCLTIINLRQKQELAERGIVFCDQIADMKLKDFSGIKTLATFEIEKIIKEAKFICDCKK